MISKRKSWASLANIAFLWLGSLAFAQQTASIHGSVLDETGQGLPGVSVTIESPNMQGVRQTVTKVNGDFLFRLLNPGEYTITTTMSGMSTKKVSVVLELGITSRPKIVMSAQAESQTLVVRANTNAVLDTSDVVSNFNAEFVDEIASGRNIRDRALLAPGTTESGVSGSVSISGAQTYENSYLLDGGNIAFDNVRGSASNIVIPDAIQETSIITGSVSAEYGQFTGGLVNTITKSGGNQFSGVLRSALRNDDWIGNTPLEDASAGAVAHTDDIIREDSISIGGPIWKDRIWFHISGWERNTEQPGLLTATGGVDDSIVEELNTLNPGFNLPTGQTGVGVRTLPGSRENQKINLKVTGKLAEGHELVFSYADEDDDALSSTTRGPLGAKAAINNLVPEEHLSINYRGVITETFNLEAIYTEKGSTFLGAGGGSGGDLRFTETVYAQGFGSGRYGAAPLKKSSDETRDNESFMIKASYFLTTSDMGSHNMVFGVQDQTNMRMANNEQTASGFEIWNVIPIWESSTDLEPTPVFTPGGATHPASGIIAWPITNESIGSDFNTQSVFINDKWVVNDKISLNLGLRYDKNDASAEDGKPVSNSKHLSPRMAFEYDLNGDGKHRFSTSYAEYTSRLNDAGQQASTAGSPSYAYWYYGGPVTTDVRDVFAWLDSLGGDTANPDERLWNTAIASNIVLDPDPANLVTLVDPNLESPNAVEYRLGYSYRFDRGFIKSDIIIRDYRDFYSVHLLQESADPSIYGITPGGQDRRYLTNDDENYERTYNAVQTQFTYRATDNLSFFGNYTWSQKQGNFIGETEGQAAVSATAVTFYPEFGNHPLANPRGYIDGDQRHIGRLFAVYNLNTSFGDFNFSATQQYQSGAAYSAGMNVNFFGNEAAYGLPTNDELSYAATRRQTGVFIGGRGAYRGESMTATDLGVNYSLNIWKIEAFVEINIFNIFDESAAVYKSANNNWVDTTIIPTGVPWNLFTETPEEGVHYNFGENFGEPLEGNPLVIGASAFQRPRTFQIDIGFKF
jgi:outer membrane receptor for ferrienterochelin and colicin